MVDVCGSTSQRLIGLGVLLFTTVLSSSPVIAEDFASYEREVPSGQVVYQFGDILVPKRVVDRRTQAGDPSQFWFSGTPWPQGVVYFEFNANVNVANREAFREWVRAWSRGTSLAFVESISAPDRILVSDDPGNPGCGSSSVSMIGGVQDLLIRCWSDRTVIHEMGHAIGLKHEHQRSDRDSFVAVVDLDGMAANCPSVFSVNWGINSGVAFSAYDFASVMHYPHAGGLYCAGQVRVVRLDSLGAQPVGPPAGSEQVCTSPTQCDTVMGQSRPSARDLYGASQIYPDPGSCRWESVGQAGVFTNASVNALAVFDDGTGPALYAGGGFSTIGGVNASGIARWNGSTWSALGLPVNGVNAPVHALAVFDDGSGPALFVGGSFGTAGGISAVGLAKWDGSQWLEVGGNPTGLNGPVYGLTVHDDGSGPALFVGGGFSTAGGAGASAIAKWNGSTWAPLGSPTNGLNAEVYALATHDDGSGPALYAGGGFSTAGGVPAVSVARWNGATWSAIGVPANGMNGPVRVLASGEAGDATLLYAGGGFTTAGSVPANSIAAWDGVAWGSLGAPVNGLNQVANALSIHDDGGGAGHQLFVGGAFSQAGGSSASSMAHWDGDNWGAVGIGMNAPVNALAIHDDGTGDGMALYAGGEFSRAWGAAASGIARYSCYLFRSGFETGSMIEWSSRVGE